MSKHLLMLDSGAFSVWNKGSTINLEEYVSFCSEHPEVSYYVALDIIPGRPGDKRGLLRNKAESEEGCLNGWKNYRRMTRELPKEKVIPVYHQNDDIRWLGKYLEHGSPYIGISPANDCTTLQRMKWMRGLKGLLFDGAGRPVVKTHGFAVTSFALMRFWEWYSVDSASWKMCGVMGGVYLPQQSQGEDDYSKSPLVIGLSPMSSAMVKWQGHINSASPRVKERTYRHLEQIGIPLGEYKIIKVEKGYSPGINRGELWYNRKKNEVLKVIVEGAIPNWEYRAIANAYFLKQANKVLPVKHIYFAGAPRLQIEPHLPKRLITYHDIGSREGKVYQVFKWHMKKASERGNKHANQS